MSVDASGETPDLPEISFHESIQKFDEAHQKLLEACASYREIPSPENQEVVQDAADTTIKLWTKSMELIVGDDQIELDEKTNILGTLIKGVDELRIAHFEKLLGKEKVFQPINDQNEIAAALFAQLDNNEFPPEAIVLGLHQSYVKDLTVDLNRFLKEVTSIPEPLENLGVIMRRTIGKHALDVAKIGAGVWLGIQLSRRNRR